MKFVHIERYRLLEHSDQVVVALRDDEGWLWCQALILQEDFQSAGPYFDGEFAVAFDVHPKPVDTRPFPGTESAPPNK